MGSYVSNNVPLSQMIESRVCEAKFQHSALSATVHVFTSYNDRPDSPTCSNWCEPPTTQLCCRPCSRTRTPNHPRSLPLTYPPIPPTIPCTAGTMAHVLSMTLIGERCVHARTVVPPSSATHCMPPTYWQISVCLCVYSVGCCDG